MDPNAALAELRALVADGHETDSDDHDRIAELVRALDTWISRGGFLPAAWQQPAARPHVTEHNRTQGAALAARYPAARGTAPICNATAPGPVHEYTCTRPAAHDGPHAAHIPGDSIIATWEA